MEVFGICLTDSIHLMAVIILRRCKHHCDAGGEKIFHPRKTLGSQSLGISPKAEANNLCSQLITKRIFSCMVYFSSDSSVPVV